METIEQQVCALFGWLCQTPHPSCGEAALRDKIADRLRGLGLNPWSDARGNLVCDLPASPGQDQAPLTAIQAHIDMVCAVGSAAYVPERDPIRPLVRDGFLCTAGESSLGADCGAGAAVMLWLAEHPAPCRPPLRLLFTVEEEIGLGGARDMDPACLDGVRYLINTDGFHWGRIVIGAAGGVREHYTRALSQSDAPDLPNGRAYRLKISGLRGGHSGFDIGKSRGNALILMGELLREIRMESPYALIDLSGGTAFNAIPYEATADILSIAPAQDAIEQIWDKMYVRIQKNDPDARLDITEIDIPDRVWSGDTASGLLTVLGGFADGVYAKHTSGVVSDSSNLGHIYQKDGLVCLDAMLRCMDVQAEYALHTSHRTVCAMCGFAGQVVSRYPAWPAQKDGRLQTLAAQCYREITGQEPEVTVQHVGLEPSHLLAKNEQMECICVGMELLDCHSPQERWKLDTVEPFVHMIERLLGRLCEAPQP